MVDLLKVEYAQTGKSANLNEMGMREMQARAFASRSSQYLLLKAPPASGKSRALMFLGLDKLLNQGLRKVIVAVPEMSIGASFRDTVLIQDGFFADWKVLPHNNLCMPGIEAGKVEAFQRFMSNPAEQTLVCTHATLRFAFEKLAPTDFNDTLIAIDEFHHVSVDGENRLGVLLDTAEAATLGAAEAVGGGRDCSGSVWAVQHLLQMARALNSSIQSGFVAAQRGNDASGRA